MTFVQNQEIIMPENVGYDTELIASYCHKGLSHTVLEQTGVNLIFREMCSCELWLLCVMVMY